MRGTACSGRVHQGAAGAAVVPLIDVLQPDFCLWVVCDVDQGLGLGLQAGLLRIHTGDGLQGAQVRGVDFPLQVVHVNVVWDGQLSIAQRFEQAGFAAAVGPYERIPPGATKSRCAQVLTDVQAGIATGKVLQGVRTLPKTLTCHS